MKAVLVTAAALAFGHTMLAAPDQFILLNLASGPGAAPFEQIARDFPSRPDARVRLGLAAIFSYLQKPRAQTIADLRGFLDRARATDTPVLVQLDGENWWGGRPDLWNWWDPSLPGYSPGNRTNVEWSSWSPDDSLKIAWRNWGRQIRVLPPPNLMSPGYRVACHEEMRALVPIVLAWWKELPADRKHLMVGIKVGWESSIGVNAWYYPKGNALLDRPEKDDPVAGLNADELPGRGVATIGFAAVKTAGLRLSGDLAEADLAEIARRHLEDLSRLAAELGVPRDRLFTHGGGWKEGELLYQAAVNRFSSPGWSFYRHATDPKADTGVQAALRASDAPGWAAVEWLLQGPRETEPWRKALSATLSDPRCRFLCIYNWEGVRDSHAVLEALRVVTGGSEGQ